MLLVNSDKVDINREDIEYMSLMTDNPKVYLDLNYMDLLVSKDEALVEGLEKIIRDYIFLVCGERPAKLTNNYLANFLIRQVGIPEKYFIQKGTNGDIISLNETVRKKLITIPECSDFMDLVNTLLETKTALSRIKPCFSYARQVELLTNNDGKLGVIPFKYTRSVTSRIYSSNFNFQGLPNRYKSIICAPKDYFLLWVDFSQIDLRVMYNMFYKNDEELTKLIDEVGDYYEAFAQRSARHCNIEFDPELFKRERPIYKQKILSTFYGSSYYTTSKDLDKTLASNLYNYINENPLYVDYVKQINTNINSNVGFYVKSYFGTEMLKHPKLRDVKTQCLNAPIQCTSADIMKIYTMSIVRTFRKLGETTGVNPSRLLSIMLNRHDECLFIIHKSLVPYMYLFTQFEKIQIDDWKPLEVHWSAGYNYGEDDVDLVNAIKISKPVEPSEPQSFEFTRKDYKPVPILWSGVAIQKTAYNKRFTLAGNIINNECLMLIEHNIHTSSKSPYITLCDSYLAKIKSKGYNKIIFQISEPELQTDIEKDDLQFVCTQACDLASLSIYGKFLDNLVYAYGKKYNLLQKDTIKPNNTLGIPEGVVCIER